MWQLQQPDLVKLIIGILAADSKCLALSVEEIEKQFGPIDLRSDAWSFTQTNYYKEQTGGQILRQFITLENLIDPGELADIKHKTNKLEQELAKILALDLQRPVNLDPGIIEPSKLIMASTKNFSHRIYIGKNMYAEVTLTYDKGSWRLLPYTYPDYKLAEYHKFFSYVRIKLLEQLKSKS